MNALFIICRFEQNAIPSNLRYLIASITAMNTLPTLHDTATTSYSAG